MRWRDNFTAVLRALPGITSMFRSRCQDDLEQKWVEMRAADNNEADEK